MQRFHDIADEPLAAFLREVRVPLRIACNGASGHPLLASLWFSPSGTQLCCATQLDAAVSKRLAADPRCSIEVSEETMPYRGVRGRAKAMLRPERGAEVLETLIERYLGPERSDFANWLRARAAREVAIEIEPLELVFWDYTKRMDGGR